MDKNTQKKHTEDCTLSCEELKNCLRFDKKSSKNNLVYYAILSYFLFFLSLKKIICKFKIF